MIENFIAIYVLFDDTMLEIGHKEPVNRNSPLMGFDEGNRPYIRLYFK